MTELDAGSTPARSTKYCAVEQLVACWAHNPKVAGSNPACATMMLQLNPTIDVKTPLGDAEAIIVIDYGINVNTVWVCRMAGGFVKHFYSDQIQIYDNPMNEKGWDVDVNKG